MRHHRLSYALFLSLLVPSALYAQSAPSDQLQVGPPPVRRAEPPAPGASAAELEKRGDELRAEKAYVDALDYYRAALSRKPENGAQLFNKAGIAELLLQRYKESKKDFERAIHADRQFADAYNNLGVIFYLQRKYGSAIDRFNKAIGLRKDTASYYGNLGAAYFSEKEYEQATSAYSQALQLDPEIFERSSHTGIAAQMSSPEDRAHFDYVLAKLLAKQGDFDRALLYLRRAMEEGYKGIDDVFKDTEFTALRKDARFTQLMASRPVAIPE